MLDTNAVPTRLSPRPAHGHTTTYLIRRRPGTEWEAVRLYADDGHICEGDEFVLIRQPGETSSDFFWRVERTVKDLHEKLIPVPTVAPLN